MTVLQAIGLASSLFLISLGLLGPNVFYTVQVFCPRNLPVSSLFTPIANLAVTNVAAIFLGFKPAP